MVILFLICVGDCQFSLILDFGVASNKPKKAQGTCDVHPRRYQRSRRCSTWRERSTGNQCVSNEDVINSQEHLRKDFLLRLNLAT